MLDTDQLTWQPSLLEVADHHADLSFDTVVRHRLDEKAWLDHVPGWLRGAGALFEWMLAEAPWHEGEMVIHGKRVTQPRLLAGWSCDAGAAPLPPRLAEMRTALCSRYDRRFDSVGVNLYRHGRDSVAWHGDRIARTVDDPLVAIVTLGEPRRLLLRPRGGRTALRLVPQAGDLVVMGGSSQRTWEHTVPKVTAAGPRISVTFRHSSNDTVSGGPASEVGASRRSAGTRALS